jgi:lysophospholipase L1-like esterase
MKRGLFTVMLLGSLLASFCCKAEEKRIVCFGDSLTFCGGENGRYSDFLSEFLPGYRVINSGRNGDTIGGALQRLDEAVLKYQPYCLVIGIGANDYWQRRRSLDELQRDYDKMLARCKESGVKAIVIISCFGNDKVEGKIDFGRAGIPLEHYAAGLAVIERSLAKKYGAGYVADMQQGITPKGRKDLWGDSNHPNAAGNRIVAETILPELKKVL